MHNRRSHPRRYKILDRERLSDLIQQSLQARCGGKQYLVRKQLGIPLDQSKLSRLIARKQPSITARTFENLSRLMADPNNPASRLGEAILSSCFWSRHDHELLFGYGRWVDRELARIAEHPPAAETWEWNLKESRFSRRTDEPNRYARLRHVEGIVRRRLPEVLERLEKRAREAGHDVARTQLAIWRTIGPLLAGPESGRIERDVTELTDKELGDFIGAGIKRERILLDRDRELHRAHDIAKLNLQEIRRLFVDPVTRQQTDRQVALTAQRRAVDAKRGGRRK